jgi:predicted RNase H-like HicB family nuclease
MMKHQVVVEFDPTTRHYTATVPGIPAIVVDAKNEKTALKWAAEAIALHLSEMPAPLQAKVVSVDV